jgi:GT2 family glycosyltransferase
VIVVDDGSFDGCAEMIGAEFPEVEYVQNQKNSGFGAANNLGFKKVIGEFLLLLNPDTEIRPNALQELLGWIKRMPTATILAPRLLNTDGSVQVESIHSLPTPMVCALDSAFLNEMFSRLKGLKGDESGEHRGLMEVEAVGGGCMVMRSRLFRELGGFNEAYFMYVEDMDLCLKLRRAGGRVYYVPGAEVVHHGGGSTTKKVNQFSSVMMRRAEEIYMRLNHGKVTAVWYRVLQGISALARLSLLGVAFVFAIGGRAAAWHSIQRWWYVLLWAMGATRIGKGEAASKCGGAASETAGCGTGSARAIVNRGELVES